MTFILDLRLARVAHKKAGRPPADKVNPLSANAADSG
jgi:hypothetical protein